MKKIVMTVAVVAMMMVSLFSVSAAGRNGVDSNMDSDTYLKLRGAQIQAALDAKTIDEDEALVLRARINEAAQNGVFGEGSEDCVLGEEGNLGIFQNENAGLRNGQGNGIGSKAADGTSNGNGEGTRTADGTGEGNANRGGNGNSGSGSRGQGN